MRLFQNFLKSAIIIDLFWLANSSFDVSIIIDLFWLANSSFDVSTVLMFSINVSMKIF